MAVSTLPLTTIVTGFAGGRRLVSGVNHRLAQAGQPSFIYRDNEYNGGGIKL